MTQRDILLRLISQHGGTQKAFAARIGVSQPTVAGWLAQGVIPPRAVSRIMDAIPGVDYDFLSGRAEEPTTQSGGYQLPRGGAYYYRHMPATAGEVPQFGVDRQDAELMVVPGSEAEAYLPVSGRSMEPTLLSGDIIGVRQVNTVDRIRPDEIYLIYTAEGDRYVKRILDVGRGHTLTLHSDNDAYRPFEVDKTEVRGIYRITCIVRNL